MSQNFLTSGIIKDMKTTPRNMWKKAEKVYLDTSFDTSSIQA